MTEYDSILKEKKKYDEPIKVKKEKKFPWLLIDIISLLLNLIISYFFYYKNILSPDKIILNDLKKVGDKYKIIFTNLNLEQLTQDKYNLVGEIELNDKKYNYELSKKHPSTNLSLELEDKKLNYYSNSNQNYLKISNFKDEYYQLNNNNYLNIITNVKNYLNNKLKEEKFIKKFYLNGTIPIVESNLELNNETIKSILNINYKDNYKTLLTFKNNAITNEIISIKIIINNLNKNKRTVILYENDYLTYKDDNQTLNFYLEEKNEDFTLKIYKNDIIYSVITGIKQQESYQYTYQIIVKIYNIGLTIKKEDNNYLYDISSIIEKDTTTIKPNLKLTIKYTDNEIVEEPTTKDNYKNLTKEEKTQYKYNIEEIIVELRQFIQKHQ